MKQLFLASILSLFGAGLMAQDHGMYWKYKDYDGAISITAPRWVIHAGSWFVDKKADRKLVRKVRKARVLVFEDQNNPVSELDMQRFYQKAKRRNLEELLTIRDKETRVWVWAKERRNAIRKVVVLVREPETFALVSVRCKLKFDELGELLNRIPKEQKGKEQDGRPLLPENVRSVIRL